MEKHYYHIFADGAQVRNFIVCDADYYAVFNLIGVAAANSDVAVLSFSIEDTHPHLLIYGARRESIAFKSLFETIYRHYIAATRRGGMSMVFYCDMCQIDDVSYLRNVGTYTIVQPTKDGKRVMPYDYFWGTGSMYFRGERYTPLWYYDKNGVMCKPRRFDSLTVREQRTILHTRQLKIPGDWVVCNGLILPENYIDVGHYEQIYRTHNCFRVFMASPRKAESEVIERMADVRGVAMEDSEARMVCGDMCKQLFGTRDPRRLGVKERLRLARELRLRYSLTLRQISSLVRLPEIEVRSFVR